MDGENAFVIPDARSAIRDLGASDEPYNPLGPGSAPLRGSGRDDGGALSEVSK